MVAAKLGAHVISIEPFYDNIVRIHKATIYENLTNSITLIRNALFNQRNQIKLLSTNTENIGGQSLISHMNKKNDRSQLKSNKNLVETILLDDIIDYLPLKNGKNKFFLSNKAIIKIDIEGLEPFAILSGKKLFEILNIQIIFMEWSFCQTITSHHEKVQEMVKFLMKKNFVPHSIKGVKLNPRLWKIWPDLDVYWMKNDLL